MYKMDREEHRTTSPSVSFKETRKLNINDAFKNKVLGTSRKLYFAILRSRRTRK